MPASWGLLEYLAAAALVGIPLLSIAAQLRAWLRDSSAARRAERAAEQRAALRPPVAVPPAPCSTPAPCSAAIEGEVVVHAAPATVVMKRQHGCLGGPIVFEVSAFQIRRDDGTLSSVALGPDPDVQGTQLLSHVPGGETRPRPTGAPDVFALAGRVRIDGVQPTQGGFAPPGGYSARLTVLARLRT